MGTSHRRKRARGSIEELPSGALRVRVYGGVDPLTKKPVYLRDTIPPGPKAKTQAEKALTRLLNQVDNRRRQNPETGEWADGEPTRHTCVAFGTLGEHLADSLGKGDRVLIVGNVVTDAWDDKDTGDKRTAQRVLVDAAGPSLRWATATIRKAQRVTADQGADSTE